jgi:hypothetical protein
MAKFVDWKDGSSGDRGDGGGGGQFLKLQGGNSYTIRLVGRPIRYMQHWEPVICRSPGVDENTKQVIDPLMVQGYQPKPRYAIWVFHREDANKFKVMDFPGVLMDQFKEWAVTNNCDPGREKGPDWVIKLEVPGGDKRRTKYHSTAKMNSAPFTEEEMKLLKESKFHDKLVELRKPNTPDEIRAMMAKRGGGGDVVAAKAEEKASATPEQAQPITKSDDDIF